MVRNITSPSTSDTSGKVPARNSLKGILHKRKDFLEFDDAAKTYPNRTYYYRRNDDVDAVIHSCSQKLSRDGGDLQALRTRAEYLRKKGDFAAAAADFTTLLGWCATDAEILYCRGSSLESQGKYEDAIKDFDQVS